VKSFSSFFLQRGVTIVELMVAVLIGLLSMYAVYRVYEGAERIKRNIVSVGDVQVNGLYSIFLLEQSIHNAGFGLILNNNAGTAQKNGTLLAACAPGGVGDVGGQTGGGGPASRTLTLRPLPVVIDPNTNPATLPVGNFDDIYVFSGRSSLNQEPVSVSGVIGGVTVGTPFGFRQNQVLVNTAGAPNCQAGLVPDNTALVNLAAPPPRPTQVTLDSTVFPVLPPVGAWLVDLGFPERHHFYVDNANTLVMEEWTLNATGTWDRRIDPIISGVMSFRAQYGIGFPTGATDDQNRPVIGPVTQWVFANAALWNMGDVQSAPLFPDAANPNPPITIRQIKAVRLSIIVRADEPDNNPNTTSLNLTNPVQFTQFADCPGPAGTVCPASPTPAFAAGWRYRMYETVIPLKNVIWN
jgi:type IV pilus assembly protein PilW